MDTPNLIRWVRRLEAMRDGTPQTDRTVDEKLADLLDDPDEFSRFNHWLEPAEANVQPARPEAGMSVDDALLGMGAIDAQRSRIGDEATDMLAAVLLSNPGAFWDSYFSLLNRPHPGAMALFVKLGSDATLADLRAALESQ